MCEILLRLVLVSVRVLEARAHIVSKLSDPVTLIGVAFGYNELWCPPYMNSLFVIPKKMWPLATTNCNGLKP